MYKPKGVILCRRADGVLGDYNRSTIYQIKKGERTQGL
jgi:hypothetical protein